MTFTPTVPGGKTGPPPPVPAAPPPLVGAAGTGAGLGSKFAQPACCRIFVI